MTAEQLRDEVTGACSRPRPSRRPAAARRGRGQAGDGRTAARRRISFTPHARRVFDLATGEALALGHNYLGCEHLLLAVRRRPTGSQRKRSRPSASTSTASAKASSRALDGDRAGPCEPTDGDED